MAVDPDDLFDVDSDIPDLNGVVLLHHLDGFMDAGSAGNLVATHLLDTFEKRVVARFDTDQLIDYRSRRPPMTYVTDHWETYEGPELVVHLLHDTDGTPFLLLTGPEPDYQWERFTVAVRTMVERWGVRRTIGFHGIPMGVPHTRPLGVTAHATRKELVAEFPPFLNQVQVPGHIAALLELRLGQAGHDAQGFAVHVPHYLTQTTYPTAAVTLLESLTRVTGLSVPVDALHKAAQAAEAEIAKQVHESSEVADVVRALEQQYDTFVEATEQRNLLADAENLPTADELGSEFERFLAEQQGQAGPQDH